MSQQQPPVLEQDVQGVTPPQAPPPAGGPSQSSAEKAAKRKRKKRIKTIVVLAIVIAVVVAVVFLMRRFLFGDSEKKEILNDTVMLGSIQSIVQGSGSTKAMDSAFVAPATSGDEVLEVYVADGQYVNAGDPLYLIDSTTAVEAVEKARVNLEDYQKQLQTIYDSYNDLTIRAPFAGKLEGVINVMVGDDISKEVKVATLVDDKKLKLSLYFSYAYEHDITLGQEVSVSIPAAMSSLTGKVDQINYVRYIAPEGAVFFEVVIVLDNPGTLTQGMTASAVLAGPGGESIYPYESATLSYYRTTEIKTKVSGPVEQVHTLINYADVTAGQTLLVLGGEDNDKLIQDKNESIKTAQKALDEAVEKLAGFEAYAPISGTVLSCNLVAGTQVQSSQGVSIADTSTMTVDIQLDERSVFYVSAGMMITLTDWNENTFMGTVISVSPQAKYENGVTIFPAVVTVDNSDGRLMSGMGVRYSFVASESNNCLLLPVATVRYVSDDETGETFTVVFLQADAPPENMATLSEEAMKEIPEGYYPVPVTVGLADNYNVEIIDGVSEGDVVFNAYITTEGGSYMYY